MSSNNATDPQPGDFDDELARIAADDVQVVQPSEVPVVSIQVTVQGGDAVTLERMAADRGKGPAEVVAELLRDAKRSAA